MIRRAPAFVRIHQIIPSLFTLVPKEIQNYLSNRVMHMYVDESMKVPLGAVVCCGLPLI
jgi:hypothetical protein